MIVLSIQGMTCESCARHIQDALQATSGVTWVAVSYDKAEAQIDTDGSLAMADVVSAIEALGYRAAEVQAKASDCCSTQAQSQHDSPHVAIIGSGSAAFACAIKAAEAGARVSIIEGAEVIGGCCVNVGCVPSKILIRAAQLAQQQRNNPFAGLENHAPALNRSLLAKQQLARVEELRQAKYQHILDSNPALSLIKGWAKFKDQHTLIVSDNEGRQTELTADKILIATGSTPTIPSIKGLSETPFWTSTEALFAEELPAHLIVIGSSVVALELAQAYRRLGSEVTILARHTLLYREDPLLGEKLSECFQNEGIQVLEHTQAESVAFEGQQFILQTTRGTVKGDRLLISTGRHANTAQLNLAAVGIDTESNGTIIVNDKMETNVAGIYAAGDCSTLPQFVYVAAAAGSRAGINMMGGEARLDLSSMPAVIFTDPQVATVGLIEAEAQQRGIETESRVLDMTHVPRALANFETDGFVKLVAEKRTGRLIGAQMLAHEGGEMIQSAALAIGQGMTVSELADQLFPYLTMVEGLKLCAQTFHTDVSQLSCCAG
jgi:mercuric reductase